MHPSRPSRALTAALVALLALASACGDDAPRASDRTAASTTTAAAGDTTAFCAAAGKMLAALESGNDPSAAVAAAAKAAPSTVGGDLTAMGEAFGAAAASGDEQAFLADDLRQIASKALGDIARVCEYRAAEVTGTEYAFGGLPTTLEPGATAFHLTNSGQQVHEMLLYRRAEGTTGDLVDVVNDDPTASDGRLDEVGVMLPAAPGEDSVLLTDLAAGDYVAVCFIPVGTASMDQVRSGENDHALDDHRSHGMVRSFTVG